MRRSMGNLEGKVVLITGASRGIGLAIARALHQEGAKLILAARNRGPLSRARAELPGTVLSMPADVTKPGEVKRLIAAVQKKIRRLDVLINNAGVFTFKPFAKTTLEEWRRNLETNLTSIFLTTQAALPLLKRSRGDIVNILSVSSRVAFPNCSAYTAAKFGAWGLTGVLRRELRAEGIRVTGILPGMTETRMKDELDFPVRNGDLLQPEDVAAAVLSALLQPRRATVEEILLMPSGGASWRRKLGGFASCGFQSGQRRRALDVLLYGLAILRFDFGKEDPHTHFLEDIVHNGFGGNNFVFLVEIETHGEGRTHGKRGSGFNEHAGNADIAREGQAHALLTFNLGSKQGARPEPPVSRLLMDQAKELVPVVVTDFRKGNRRAFPCDDVPDAGLGLNDREVLGKAKAHRNLISGLESGNISEEEPSPTQRVGDAPEGLFSRRVIHCHADSESRVPPQVHFTHELTCEFNDESKPARILA